MNTNAFEIASAVFAIMLSVIGFFLLRLLKGFDELSKSHGDFKSDFSQKMAIMERDVDNSSKSGEMIRDVVLKFELIKRDIEMAVTAAKDYSRVKEELTILKRDQNTLWKKLDEFKATQDLTTESMNVFRDRSHYLINKVSIIKAKAEKAGWTFGSDWEFTDKENG